MILYLRELNYLVYNSLSKTKLRIISKNLNNNQMNNCMSCLYLYFLLILEIKCHYITNLKHPWIKIQVVKEITLY